MEPGARTLFEATLGTAIQRAEAVAASPQADVHARSMASALYHLTTAIAMAWEAGQTRSARRMVLAQLVLKHRVLPKNPLDMPTDGSDDLDILDADYDTQHPAVGTATGSAA